MARTIIRSPRSVLDILEVYGFIGEDSVDAADRFLDALDKALELLAAQPKLGQEHPVRHRDLRGLRHWPITGFENYLIFYLPLSDGIELVRVLHGMRDVRSILME